MSDAAVQTANSFTQPDFGSLPFVADGGIGVAANLGLLVLKSDQTIEDEFRFMLPQSGVALYGARLYNDVEITPANLLKMVDEIPKAAGLLPDVAFGAVGFACTSGALVIGEETVAERVRSVLPSARVTDPVTAALAAMKALGAKRIALLTPYIATINDSLRRALTQRGLDIAVMGSFNEADDNVVARITPSSIEDAALRIGGLDGCDAVFVSCTSLRVAKIAEGIERRLGKPVTSSNHALAWHMLRLAGYDEEIAGRGALFRLPLKE